MASKTVTISRLMELAPAGTVDPSSTLYNSTMYAMAGLLGIALVANSWWPLLLLPLVLVVVQRGVIEREERYLEARFGQEYRDYKVRVRRWL